MMFRRMGLFTLSLAFSGLLASCKVPATFSEALSSGSSTDSVTDTTEEGTVPADEEVVSDVCGQLDSDTHNAAQGDVLQDPFMSLSFASGPDLLLPQGPCVQREVLQDSELIRKVQFTYDCREVKGRVVWTTRWEEEAGPAVSVVETSVELIGRGGGIRQVQSVHTQTQFADGASQVDREFQETFQKDGVEHQIAGVYFYDFIPDEESVHPGEGFVQISGNVSHTRGEVIENVYSLTSEGLHRSPCGFDDGRVVLRTNEKVKTVTYSGCGKLKIAEAEAESVE